MTVEEQEIMLIYKIYVPSLTKAGAPIPKDILKNFCDTIMERFTRHNGGCTTILNTVGCYLSATGEIVKETGNIIESTGEFPFSNDEMSLFARLLDQECIRVEEAGLVKAYHYNGEIEPISDFEIKTDAGSIGYSIDANPAQFIDRGDDVDVEVLDIPDKYIIYCISYDEDGQPTRGVGLNESDISQKMSEPECDIATNLLFQGLLNQLNILNSR